MKKIILSAFIALTAFGSIAQSDLYLKINHKLGANDFAVDAVGTNDLGNEFKASRLEYYITRVTVLHDGGMEEVLSDDVVALVRPQDEIATSISLGNFDFTTIESVKFHIGVYAPVNNEDPSLYEMSHPLAPKSPSMHWGWASGYRFIAYEGLSGSGFAQNFQLHGLGNENYFEVSTNVEVEEDGTVKILNIDGDYAAGLNGIDLASGVTSHGSTGDAKKVLENWKDLVFGPTTLSIENKEEINWSIYPNPSSGAIVVNFEGDNKAKTIQVSNALGELVQTNVVKNTNRVDITLNEAGIYFVAVLDEKEAVIATERIVIN